MLRNQMRSANSSPPAVARRLRVEFVCVATLIGPPIGRLQGHMIVTGWLASRPIPVGGHPYKTPPARVANRLHFCCFFVCYRKSAQTSLIIDFGTFLRVNMWVWDETNCSIIWGKSMGVTFLPLRSL